MNDIVEPALAFARQEPELVAWGIVVLAVSLAWLQRLIAVFNLKRPTIPAVFILTYIPMIYLPAFWVYFDRTGPARDTYMIGVLSVMLTVPMGIALANGMFRFSARGVDAYYRAQLADPGDAHAMFHVHLALIAASVVAAWIYFTLIPTIPVLELLSQADPTALALAREESFKLLDPRWHTEESTQLFYVFLFLRTLVFPFVILTTLGYALVTREARWWVLFALALAVGGAYAVASLSRAPISAIFLRIFFFLFLAWHGNLPRKVVILFAALMLAFPLLVTTYGYRNDADLAGGLLSLGRRLTYTPAEDLYYYFEIFPRYHDYLYGHTLAKPVLQVLGFEYFYIENYVHQYISPLGIVSGHANAAFPSNLHADFGLPGVFVGGLLVGLLVQWLQILLSRGRKTVLNVAVYAFLIYAIWALNFGSVTSVLFVNGLIPVFLLALALHWAARASALFRRGLAAPPAAQPAAL